MKLRYVILYVDDVSASLAFYREAFGLETRMLHEGGDYGELETGDTRLAFSSRALMRSLGKSPGAAEVERPVFEVAFEVDDVAAAFARARAAGARVVQAPRDEPWGQTTSYVADPDGVLVEICSVVSSAS